MEMRSRIIAGLMLLTVSTPVHASQVICFLEVNGQIFMQGRCNYSPDTDGSFSIGTDDPKAKYFAYVTTSAPNEAAGYWNGVAAASHAHESLGNLHRDGGCWINDSAKVCAWR